MALLPVHRALFTFRFVGVHQNADVCPIFRFEPMHSLKLGVGLLLYGFTWNMLGNASRDTRAIKTRSGSDRTFEAVKSITFSEFIRFLTDCQEKLISTGLGVNFKKPEQSIRLTGLFFETGLPGMLGEADFQYVYIVFYFLGAIVENVVHLNYLSILFTCVHFMWTWSTISDSGTCPQDQPWKLWRCQLRKCSNLSPWNGNCSESINHRWWGHRHGTRMTTIVVHWEMSKIWLTFKPVFLRVGVKNWKDFVNLNWKVQRALGMRLSRKITGESLILILSSYCLNSTAKKFYPSKNKLRQMEHI